jgi:hypothetical protein
MVMAKIDRHFTPKPPTKPLPEKCEPHNPDFHKLGDSIEFALKDKDHSGELDKGEFGEGKGLFGKVIADARFAHYDADHNGKISHDEYLAGKASERTPHMKAKLELPKDGGILGKIGKAVEDTAKEIPPHVDLF